MAIYARVEDGIVVELIDTGDYAITQLFAPSFVASMVRVPEGVVVELGTAVEALKQDTEAPPVTVAGTPDIPNEEPGTDERTWRQSILSASQWLMTRHRDEQELGRVPTLTAAQYLELLEYRQALRDWPASNTFPAVVTRPSMPSWLLGVVI
jgi:hypothetical protein